MVTDGSTWWALSRARSILGGYVACCGVWLIVEHMRIAKAPFEFTKDPHADPLEVSILIAEAKPANSIHFISDDEELRIRVREFLRKHPVDRWRVLDFATLLPGCEAVVQAENLELINSEPSAVIQLCPPAAQANSPSRT